MKVEIIQTFYILRHMSNTLLLISDVTDKMFKEIEISE